MHKVHLPQGTDHVIRSPRQLREDALRIWRAGVQAVRADRLVEGAVRLEGNWLRVASLEPIDVRRVRRIEVVGAGKAGAGMAAGLEAALAPLVAAGRVAGWLNVPADTVRPLTAIYLHAARPAGVNEPTAEGVRGCEEILRRVAALNGDDLCLCLLSGGGSALLPAPAASVKLEDKQALTRYLSAAGANIRELNTVRKQLSRIKGGGLARACRAGRLITLVISDVLGDPLEIIASGPTYPDSSTPGEALSVLAKFGAIEAGIAPAAVAYLKSQCEAARALSPGVTARCQVEHCVIGNNAAAVDAAGAAAEQLGYSHAMHAATELEGQAEEIGRRLAAMARDMRHRPGPDCLITGGEPVVRLAPLELRGRGGRNQQLVLAALEALADTELRGIAVLSGGTDGEDGPTDAAGAIADEAVYAQAVRRGLNPREFLTRNDAYHFFEPLDGLIKTGPTHTNVCDIRVVCVSRGEA